MWLNRVRESGTSDLNITWKSFSLEQVNSKEGPDWKVWDHPQREQSRSLLALWAAEAARRQGTEAFERFHLALLTARHGGDGRIPLNEIAPMLDVAETSSLDVAKFQRDLNDKGLLDNVARDHTEATQDGGHARLRRFRHAHLHLREWQRGLSQVVHSARRRIDRVLSPLHRPHVGALLFRGAQAAPAAVAQRRCELTRRRADSDG